MDMFCFQCQETFKNTGCVKKGCMWKKCKSCKFTRFFDLDIEGSF